MTLKKVFLNSGFVIMAILIVLLSAIFFKTSFTLSQISTAEHVAKPVYMLPELEDLPTENENKLNILLLGQRGVGDPSGGLLTDAIMLASWDKKTDKVTLISLPRDLYVPMPNAQKRDKLNAVYAWGYEKEGVSLGLHYIKDTVSRLTGLYVDGTILVNFSAFKQFINSIGGIQITRSEDFIEDRQWWCDENGKNCRPFIVPKGVSQLDGTSTLFYIRSRFSSSDFDRAKRQQEVLLAIKNKIFSLGFLSNPIHIINLLDLLGENIRTDLSGGEIKDLAVYLKDSDFNAENIQNLVVDDSPQGLLYARHINGLYVLLPRGGDFSIIRDKCLEVTNN